MIMNGHVDMCSVHRRKGLPMFARHQQRNQKRDSHNLGHAFLDLNILLHTKALIMVAKICAQFSYLSMQQFNDFLKVF